MIDARIDGQTDRRAIWPGMCGHFATPLHRALFIRLADEYQSRHCHPRRRDIAVGIVGDRRAKPLREKLRRHAVDHGLAAQFFTERFRAAIAYYPYCDIPAAGMTVPALILIGEADEQCPVERCREMAAHARPDSAPISLTVYPGVYHNFVVALLFHGVRYGGYWLEYTAAAAKDAEEKTRSFLAAHLAETSP